MVYHFEISDFPFAFVNLPTVALTDIKRIKL